MKIFLFHAAAGHGHKKIAEVLEKSFHKRNDQIDSLVLEDALDSTPGLFKNTYPLSYFLLVKYAPFLWGWAYELLDQKWLYKILRPLRSWFNLINGHRLLKRVCEEKPDVIICTHFFSAELFATAKKKGKLDSLLITVITDFFPHTFWVNQGTDYYWVMNESSKEDLLGRGVKEDEIIPGGIPVDPIFLPSGEKKLMLQKFKMEPERTTLLITSGSFGLGPYAEILNYLKQFQDKVQCLVICGNNEAMEHALKRETYTFPVKVFGFVKNMPELMEASDLLLAKPGGSTTVESLAKGIPMVIIKPIPGQESRNARFLKSHDVSFSLNEPRDIVTILEHVFSDNNILQDKKEKVREVAKPYAADDLVSFTFETLRKSGKA